MRKSFFFVNLCQILIKLVVKSFYNFFEKKNLLFSLPSLPPFLLFKSKHFAFQTFFLFRVKPCRLMRLIEVFF